MTTWHNIKKSSYLHFWQQITGSNRYSEVAVSALQRFNLSSEGAVVVMRAKVTLTRKFWYKNNKEIYEITMDFRFQHWTYEGKKSNGTRNMKNINFPPKGF